MSDDGKGLVAEFREEIDPTVFLFGALLTVGVIVAFFVSPNAVESGISSLNGTMLGMFNWALLLIVFLVVVFLLFLIVGPWGAIKLGDESPEYSFLSFFSMLYSAGFAAGVVFWGPTEALFYYANPSPLFEGVQGSSAEAMTIAVQQTMFHWALPQLAVFTIMGIAIGYFAYNYENVPLRVSSALTPIIGADNLDGPVAKVVDILAVFATIGGVATSLGFIGSQFVTGLDYQWGISMGNVGILLVVTFMTLLFTTSMVLGVDKGIRRLSNFNMVLFVVLMLSTFLVGPTLFLLLLGTQAFGGMVSDFVAMSLFTGAGPMGAGNMESTNWMNAWTVFYWAWALSWSPFAGLFIARISKGRTVREVAFTGIVATSAATIPWFTFIGGTAVWAQHNGVADFGAVIAGEAGAEVSGFILFEALQFTLNLGGVSMTLPVGTLLMYMFLILVTTFFVTSADSSTLAVSMMTTGGKARPSTINRIFWGVVLGLTAAILMILGGTGSANTLQQAAIITGTPFAFVCFLALLSLMKDFGSNYGRVLLQDETVLVGSSRKSEPDPPGAGDPVESDDD
ncbi:choline/carnitine/betaine transport [Halogeometricum rufum]|uniref:Choline/carnitine/betaine transport n=1 Tax=Halogeometricum rufum TaxID=553469 RepID=A0A1I6I7C4_9EURY|nr:MULTISPECIES: BCCT family transporter [Halogeometricum]MUV56352.1 BCCT family transporter [Halogeometricum sp. CBA1124]SFR62581.1 choline/carnitine/betaine transport [Halogeometricum rufum]